jgi:MoxR-like ATPase
MKFTSTESYVATEDLSLAVDAAVALERPLLVKGEPGTGKTELARQVAASLGLPLIEWHIKSTTRAQQGLYEYDAVSRLRDSQLGDERVHDISNYIKKGKLWQAFEAEGRVVLLIDEVDKADIEFPNDLLQELDRMEFFVYETGQTVRARQRPVVIITSNNEKELPDAFLRRCFFHYIRFPDPETLRRIVEVHHPGIKEALLTAALTRFYEIRETPGVKKKPSTSEVLDWLKRGGRGSGARGRRPDPCRSSAGPSCRPVRAAGAGRAPARPDGLALWESRETAPVHAVLCSH